MLRIGLWAKPAASPAAVSQQFHLLWLGHQVDHCHPRSQLIRQLVGHRVILPTLARNLPILFSGTFWGHSVDQGKIRTGAERRLMFDMPGVPDGYHRPDVRGSVRLDVREIGRASWRERG